MEPFLGGGEMIRDVDIDRATWNDIPWRFEAGTPNVAEAVGLGAAVDYLQALGMDRVRAHEVDVTGYALKRLGELDGLVWPSEVEHRGGMVSFTLGDIHPHDVAQVLDADGIAVRAGHHCAKPLLRRLGVQATTRPRSTCTRPPRRSTRWSPASRRSSGSSPRSRDTEMGLDDLYQEIILDHYKKPRHPGRLEDAQVEVHPTTRSAGTS